MISNYAEVKRSPRFVAINAKIPERKASTISPPLQYRVILT
jgi:hypothetical protein